MAQGSLTLFQDHQNVESHLITLFEKLEAVRKEAKLVSLSAPRISMHTEVRTLEFWRSIISECIGTFFYVFIVCGASTGEGGFTVSSASMSTSGLMATALASGFAMATLTQCFGHISVKPDSDDTFSLTEAAALRIKCTSGLDPYLNLLDSNSSVFCEPDSLNGVFTDVGYRPEFESPLAWREEEKITTINHLLKTTLSSLSQDLNLCLLVNNYRELSANHALARSLVSLAIQSLTRLGPRESLCDCSNGGLIVAGAHVNPAVTVAMAVTRNVSALRAFMFVTAQCGGGIAGAALLYGSGLVMFLIFDVQIIDAPLYACNLNR
uniref:Uncharacterized protein n=1 Tax=Timema bartmani TaxID=61472 RepID=A0A7R9EWK6_9NEOP|nr:unnamed protein product [Timema bartmani]